MTVDDSKQVSKFPGKGGRFQVSSELGDTGTPSPFAREKRDGVSPETTAV